MKQLETVWLVYRSHYEGGLSKRSVRLPGSSVLDWFRHAWRETLSLEEDAIEKWVESECAGYIYGLSSIFTAAKENGLPPPNSWSELIAYLNEYLYVEGEIVHDAETIRVLTNDDEVELAYFFFTDKWAIAN